MEVVIDDDDVDDEEEEDDDGDDDDDDDDDDDIHDDDLPAVTNLPCKLFAVISVSVLEAFYAFSENRVLTTVQPFAKQIVAVTGGELY